jgi:hypothetical protein
MFCEKCGGLLNKDHTKEICSRVRKEIREQNKPSVDKTEKQLPESDGSKTSRILLYFHHANGVLPGVRIYRANILSMYRTSDYNTHIEIASGADFFNGVYAPSYVNSKRMTAIIGRMSNLKGVVNLSNGALHYSIVKTQTKETFELLTKYISHLPDSFASVQTGLEQKLMREWRINQDDYKEIIGIVKDNLFTDQK